MKAKFSSALANVLVHEGGYSNHPKDPGGATMWGVTQRVYDNYRKSQGKKPQPVKKINAAERDAIYRNLYWNPIKGDRLPAGIDYAVFDGAVNSGVSQSVKWVQRALGNAYNGSIDGIMGDLTVKAVLAYPDHDALIARILDRRLAFLKALRTWSTFGRGWSNRVAQVKKIGQAWASGSVGPEPVYAVNMDAKAYLADAKTAPGKGPADAAQGGGAVSAALAQATDQLTPLSNIDFVAKAVAVLTIAGVVIFLGGLGYRYWSKRKESELRDALDLPSKAVPA
ncbi:glycoside hydrolase family 108 protein [Phyllobacterium sp. 21LDTY02-6]|uniref:glycoside hydrolase family 108 protein n=1 Tax=Phyllobacterium sp. 21LDTY02-6 TaxID=2944903 RepID=UPI0020209F10|nr:glycoside hydrolase family 108 protein [Phyllobacterium sp. 21LDTY02-6]MCO4316355.1 glycoside hydrolase family 108 protein [Phyllobacterium sp. 21LDTY02-6]